MAVTGDSSNAGEKHELNEWHSNFCKLSQKLFSKLRHKRNAKKWAEFFDILISVQQKGRRVLIRLQDKIDRKKRVSFRRDKW